MVQPDNGYFHDRSDALPPGFMDFKAVEARLIEGMEVLLRSRDPDAMGRGASSIWGMVQDEPGNDPDEADKPIITRAFTRQQQDRAAEALEWIARYVPTGPTRKVLGIALKDHVLNRKARIEWPEVWRRMGGRKGGWTTEALRKRYSRAVMMVCNGLNARSSAG